LFPGGAGEPLQPPRRRGVEEPGLVDDRTGQGRDVTGAGWQGDGHECGRGERTHRGPELPAARGEENSRAQNFTFGACSAPAVVAVNWGFGCL